MNNKFDELAKSLAQSVTRRAALKKFSFGLAGVLLASLGLTNEAHADPKRFHCHCKKPYWGCVPGSADFDVCYLICGSTCTPY